MSQLAFFVSNMKKCIAILALICLLKPCVFSQDFRGIEFRIDFDPSDTLLEKRLTVNVYYKSIDTVQIDTFKRVHCFGWQNFPKINHYFLTDNIQMLQFRDKVYIASGFNYCVTDTFYIEGIKNYNDENLTPIQFSTEFFTLSSYDVDAIFNYGLNEGYFDDGIYHFDASALDPNGTNLAYYFRTGFGVGQYDQYYSMPVGTDTIRMDTLTGAIRWNRPTVPGKYLIVIGYADSFSPVPTWWDVSLKRYMVIEVKPEDIVSGNTNSINESTISISPNPARGRLFLSLNAISCGSESKLSIYNVLGQELFSESVQNPQNTIKKEIDISYLKAGVYLLSFEACGRIKTEKVVVD